MSSIVRVAATLWNIRLAFDNDEKQIRRAAFTCSEVPDRLTESLVGARVRSSIWTHISPFCGDSAERDGCLPRGVSAVYSKFWTTVKIQQMQMQNADEPMSQSLKKAKEPIPERK